MLCAYCSVKGHLDIASHSLQEVAAQEASSMQWGQFKSVLADAVVAHLEPIQQRYHKTVQDQSYLDQVVH